MFVTLLAAALVLAADPPQKPSAAPLPDAPTGAPVAMPDIGALDPDTLCFVAATFLAGDQRTAGKDAAAADMEATYFIGASVRKFDDASLTKALDAAMTWVTGKQLDALHAACHDRYARDVQRLRNAVPNR